MACFFHEDATCVVCIIIVLLILTADRRGYFIFIHSGEGDIFLLCILAKRWLDIKFDFYCWLNAI